MKNTVESILKKINYIEVEIEIQKQILHSIPSNKEKDIESVIKKIAQAKKDIEQLRSKLKETSPREYNKLISIEQAVEKFNAVANKKQFTKIESMSSNPQCSITRKKGVSDPCLVKARDAEGNWTIITLEGELEVISCDDVADAD